MVSVLAVPRRPTEVAVADLLHMVSGKRRFNV